MNKELQTTGAATRPCDRFDWCDGQLHRNKDLPLDFKIHTRREYFIDRGVEVCLGVWEPEQRAYVYVNPRNLEWDDDEHRNYDAELFELKPALDLALEWRRVADAIERAARDVVTINASLAEVPC